MTVLEHTGTPAIFKAPSLVLEEISYSSTELIINSFTQLFDSNISASRINETLLK